MDQPSIYIVSNNQELELLYPYPGLKDFNPKTNVVTMPCSFRKTPPS